MNLPLKVAPRGHLPNRRGDKRQVCDLDPASEGTLAYLGLNHRKIVVRALRNQVGPKAKIKAQCLLCTGGVVADIRGCPARADCALWHDRPYQRKSPTR